MAQLSANGGHWSPSGTIIYRLPKFIFSKSIMPGGWITVDLGAIKLRNDGRWNWWRWRSEFFSEWREGQGVALTQTGATLRVLAGWYTTATEPAPMADVYEYTKRRPGPRWWEKTEVLGQVINTHTGVWTWVRHKSKSNPTWQRGRGTSASCRLAHQNLMDGWPEELQPGEKL